MFWCSAFGKEVCDNPDFSKVSLVFDTDTVHGVVVGFPSGNSRQLSVSTGSLMTVIPSSFASFSPNDFQCYQDLFARLSSKPEKLMYACFTTLSIAVANIKTMVFIAPRNDSASWKKNGFIGLHVMKAAKFQINLIDDSIIIPRGNFSTSINRATERHLLNAAGTSEKFLRPYNELPAIINATSQRKYPILELCC